MANTKTTAQDQLSHEIACLYQHFLAGDIGTLEFSELVDDLIGIHSLIDSVEESQLCTV
ncbi:hypothetical protein C1752_10192 [Acaryochloris thomasi RCC1774]|uniref:Uncharacterized protein n=1 Tax=Acaryochloris thomasi RCC1774 TaxID=1764569 RepID=A0A2W1JP56_9CYAN|nr:hypothetical protein [Acaryochloris thomasi]PZD70677.1 hypothetical protein C1752_10192 [Acaryochloris thomasi RCC1774]